MYPSSFNSSRIGGSSVNIDGSKFQPGDWGFLLVFFFCGTHCTHVTKTSNYFASSDPHHGIQFIPSDILSGKSSGILFDILSGISSGLLSVIFSDIILGISI